MVPWSTITASGNNRKLWYQYYLRTFRVASSQELLCRNHKRIWTWRRNFYGFHVQELRMQASGSHSVECDGHFHHFFAELFPGNNNWSHSDNLVPLLHDLFGYWRVLSIKNNCKLTKKEKQAFLCGRSPCVPDNLLSHQHPSFSISKVRSEWVR